MAFPSGMGWGRRSSPCPATLRVQRFNTKNGILRFTFRSAVMYLWACEGAFCETPLFRVLLKQTNKQTNGKHPHANIPILPLTTKPRSAPCCFYGRIHTSPPPAEQRPAQRCATTSAVCPWPAATARLLGSSQTGAPGPVPGWVWWAHS